MEATRSSEKMITYNNKRRHNPENFDNNIWKEKVMEIF
jgi:hypothetical protein